MVGLNAVVGVPIGAVPGRWQEVIEHHWVDRRLVSHDFAGLRAGRADGLLEEPTRRRVALVGHEHVDDLSELIDGTVDVAPAASDPDVGLVNHPASADTVSAGPGHLGQLREQQHPSGTR